MTRYEVNVYYVSVKGSVKLGVNFSVMFHSTTETTFAPKPEVALRVYCVAVRSAILATAWLLVAAVIGTFKTNKDLLID